MTYHAVEHYFFQLRHIAEECAGKIIDISESDFLQLWKHRSVNTPENADIWYCNLFGVVREHKAVGKQHMSVANRVLEISR